MLYGWSSVLYHSIFSPSSSSPRLDPYSSSTLPIPLFPFHLPYSSLYSILHLAFPSQYLLTLSPNFSFFFLFPSHMYFTSPFLVSSFPFSCLLFFSTSPLPLFFSSLSAPPILPVWLPPPQTPSLCPYLFPNFRAEKIRQVKLHKLNLIRK